MTRYNNLITSFLSLGTVVFLFIMIFFTPPTIMLFYDVLFIFLNLFMCWLNFNVFIESVIEKRNKIQRKMKLPKHIKDKIKKIVQLERERISVMDEINEWNPEKLAVLVPVEALREGWDWQMYFTGTPRPINYKEIEAILLTALTGNVHKPNYGKQKTITLSEVRSKCED